MQLINNGKAAFVPGDGYLNCIDKNDDFLISGFSRRGKVVGDIPGIRFQVAYVAGFRFVCPLQREEGAGLVLPLVSRRIRCFEEGG